VLNNVNGTSLNDKASNETLVQTVASIYQVPVSYVKFVSYILISTTTQTPLLSKFSKNSRVELLSSTTVFYTINATTITTVNVVDYPTQDSSQVLATFSTNMKAAVKAGNFTKALQSNAQIYGAPKLFSSSSNTVSSSVDIQNPSSGSSNNNNKLSGGQIAGIVIGSIFGFFLLVVLIYFVYAFSRKDEGAEGFNSVDGPTPVDRSASIRDVALDVGSSTV
jgi:hypothetical protein